VLDTFVEYRRIRLADDPHLWASTPFDEPQPLGSTGLYKTLTAAIRPAGAAPDLPRSVTPPGPRRGDHRAPAGVRGALPSARPDVGLGRSWWR
jgi:hypothetical protein